MEEDLISKKDLLELTGISYGQLYRWKRKDLIPEQWFIRRSTFTGQETFFPRQLILSRINQILNMKDGLSLDALSDMLSPSPSEKALYKEEIISRGIATPVSLHLMVEQLGDAEVYAFDKVLYVYLLEKLLQSGDMSLDEGKTLLQVLNDHYKKLDGKNCELMLIRKMGISTFLLFSSPTDLYMEAGAKVVSRMHLGNCIQELKMKLI